MLANVLLHCDEVSRAYLGGGGGRGGGEGGALMSLVQLSIICPLSFARHHQSGSSYFYATLWSRKHE